MEDKQDSDWIRIENKAIKLSTIVAIEPDAPADRGNGRVIKIYTLGGHVLCIPRAPWILQLVEKQLDEIKKRLQIVM